MKTKEEKMTMYQVFYVLESNMLERYVADVSADYLVEFSKGKLVLKIIRH